MNTVESNPCNLSAALPPTGPELANNKRRSNRKRRNWSETKRDGEQGDLMCDLKQASVFNALICFCIKID